MEREKTDTITCTCEKIVWDGIVIEGHKDCSCVLKNREGELTKKIETENFNVPVTLTIEKGKYERR